MGRSVSLNHVLESNLKILKFQAIDPTQKYRVNADGFLVHVTSWADRFHYFFHQSEIEKRVQQAVDQIVQAVDLSSSPTAIENLFFKELAFLPPAYFDRTKISAPLKQFLLQRVNEKSEEASDNHPSPAYAKVMQELRLARALGIDFELNNKGGVTGSYLGKDLNGKILVIFKPTDEGAEGSPKAWFRKHVWLPIKQSLFPDSCLSPELLTQSEIITSVVDQFFNLGLVPETREETFQSKVFNGENHLPKKGSCQRWVHGAVSAKSLVDNDHPSAALKGQLDRLAILDFITTNTDRHLDNLLIKGDQVIAIDNARAFPKQHPAEYTALRNLHGWKQLKFAQSKFTPEAQALILQIVNKEKAFMAVLRKRGLSSDQCSVVRDKIAVLKKCVNKTPAKLAKIRTPQEVNKALGK